MIGDSLAALPKQARNHLRHIYVVPEASLIVGDCHPLQRTGNKAGLCIFSLRDGKKDTTVYLRENEWVDVLTVSGRGGYSIVATHKYDDDKRNLACYSLREKRWLWNHEDLDYFEYAQFIDADDELLTIGEHTNYWIEPKSGRIVNRRESFLREYHELWGSPHYGGLSPSGRQFVFWQKSFLGPGGHITWRPRKKKEIDVWDVRNNEKVNVIEHGDSCYSAVSFMADEEHILLGCFDGTVRLWSLKEKAFIKELKLESGHFGDFFISKNGPFIGVINMFDVSIFRYPSFEIVKTFKVTEGVEGGANAMAFSDDGKCFAIEIRGLLYLYDTASWQELWHIDSSP